MKQFSAYVGMVMAALSSFSWSHPGHAQAGVSHELVHAAWLLAAVLVLLLVVRRQSVAGALHRRLRGYHDRNATARLRSHRER